MYIRSEVIPAATGPQKLMLVEGGDKMDQVVRFDDKVDVGSTYPAAVGPC